MSTLSDLLKARQGNYRGRDVNHEVESRFRSRIRLELLADGGIGYHHQGPARRGLRGAVGGPNGAPGGLARPATAILAPRYLEDSTCHTFARAPCSDWLSSRS